MKIRFGGGSRVDAEYKGYTIHSDQPTHAGGAGSAPAPFDYFLASIGNCAGYYVLSFLQHRDLPLEGVEVSLRTVKDRERKRISDVIVTVELPEGFPEKYRRAIARAVDLCSVKRHILEPPRFETVVEVKSEAALPVA